MMEDTQVFQQTEIVIDENELSIPFTVQNFYSTFDKYELFYSAEDLKLVFSRFNNFHQICSLIQDFVYISRYNLKRNNISNRNVLTYVCSCISQKRMPNKSTLNDNYDIDHNKSGTSLSLKRNSKRDNIQSCYFRIRFKKIINTEGYCYSIMLNTNLMHNHPPDKSKTKESFQNLYRNLKFPLDSVYHLFYTLIQKYKDNFNNNDNEKININNLTKNLSFLQEIKADLSLSFNFLKGKSAKTRWNINKKLNHLIRISLQIIDKLNNDKLIFLSRDEEIMNKLIEKFLKQSSGSYLRMEENEELYHNIYRI